MPRLKHWKYDAWASAAFAAYCQDKPALVAVDTETTGVGFYDQPFAATLAWRRPSGELSSWYFDFDTATARAVLSDILIDCTTWVGHNLKFDLQKLILAGIGTPELVSMTTLHDTQAMAHLLDENDRKALKYLAVKVLGYDDTVEVEIKSGPNKGKTRLVPKEEHRLAAVRRELKLKKEDGYHLLPRKVLIPYALRDTEFTLRLYEKLYPRLRDKGVLDWYQVEIELLRALLDLESDGLRLDMEYLDAATSEYGVKAMTLWQGVIRLAGKDDLNLNSPAQLLEVFKQRGYHLDSTGEAELKKLDDDLARAILDYRGVYKVYKTYLKGLQDEQLDGLVHPSFNPTGARTGRLSSGSAKE